MDKTDFVLELANRLDFLPFAEVQERIAFYIEMIDDRMDQGFSEEDAVSKAGNIDEIVSQIVADIPLSKLVKEKIKSKKRFKAWEITLLVLGSPIWISLLIAAFAVIFAIYVVLWSVIISFWSVFAAVLGCVLGCAVCCAVLLLIKNWPAGIAAIAAVLILTGLAIFLFFGCKAASNGILLLTRKAAAWMKMRFMKKEEA